MMPRIDKIKWGSVWVEGEKYHQVLIVGEKVFEREGDKLRNLFGTTHQIGNWEQELLLSQDPEIILVANGWSGVLKVSSKLKVESAKLGVELKIVLTGKARKEYNRLVGEGKRVNALIHTTC
jgi:hypothetical protein